MSLGKRNKTAPEGVSARQVRSYYENADKKKTAKTAGIIAAVMVVLFAAALFVNSNYIRRHATAVTIGEMKYSAVEFNYYYYDSYMTYANWVYSNLSSLGDASAYLPDSKPWKSQYYDEAAGQTWADFFASMALETMTENARIRTEAKQKGYVLPDEKRAELDKEFADLEEQYTGGAFQKQLVTSYGKGMTVAVYKKINDDLALADAYSEYVEDSFSYTEEALDAYYGEKVDLLDTFTYRYMLINSATVTETDYETTEAYEAAQAEALAVAQSAADELAAGVRSEEDFIAAAKAYGESVYDEESGSALQYAEPASTLRYYKGELLGSIYGEWMREAGRKYGDVNTFPLTTGSGVYVVYFIDRSDNEYPTASLRRILITPEAVDSAQYAEDETTDAYDAAVAKALTDAAAKAKTLYDEWVSGGATEEAFIALMADNSSDTAEEGLYEFVHKKQLANAVDDWLFAPGRKTGDSELTEVSEGEQLTGEQGTEPTGWYLLYYVGEGQSYHDYLAETGNRAADVTAWNEALPELTSVNHWAFRLAE
ncbi:MAG: hypothetical protein LBT12_02680 [Oscillospiraceae bacterium]|nr:hypothetical protein [Oscillospiraceae bacterium]